jgi:protein-tyrosine phosphatase
MRHLLGQKGLAIEVDSAGTGPYRDVPAYHLVVEAVAGLGIDLSRHRSKPVDARLLERADLILAMAPEHVRWLRSARPDLAGRIRLLRPYCLGLEDPAADEDPAHQIPDPIGLPARAHQECVATLRSLLERLVARWSP